MAVSFQLVQLVSVAQTGYNLATTGDSCDRVHLSPAAMEASKFLGKMWVVSHKPVAVAAGLGQMCIHRNVIHPRSGSFILLGTVLLAAEVDEESKPVAYDP